MAATRDNLTPRPRALAVAVASCAAAALGGPAAGPAQPVSVQAVAQLGRHAAGDARDAMATARRSPRRARRLLARSSRRLGYAHTMAALVQADQDAAWAAAAAPFARASSEVARYAAGLAGRTRGRLEGRAVRTLRQTARRQCDMALELAASRFPGSLTELRHALHTAVEAQDQLLAVLTGISASDQITARRRHGLGAARRRAQDAREALSAALARVRSALPAEGDEQAMTDIHDFGP